MKVTPLQISSSREAENLLRSLGVTAGGIQVLTPKTVYGAFFIEGLRSWEANIIKQHLLSLGSDAAISRGALVKDIRTNTFVFGSVSQLHKLCDKLKSQPFGLKEIAAQITLQLTHLAKDSFTFKARGKALRLKEPLVCGIVNVTPDSFSGDGLLHHGVDTPESVIRQVAAMVKSGARMIDIGGESTRPFAKPVSDRQEIKRVIPSLRAVRRKFPKLVVSVDTYKYAVAKAAVEEGADIINDITAFAHSPRIATLVAKHKLGCILMHMKGTPRTMQKNPSYKDVMSDLVAFFDNRLSFARSKGIKDSHSMIDPGIGFGKRVEDNLVILDQLYKLRIFGLPLFVGLSRKSFVGKTLHVEGKKRLSGTIAASVVAIANGARVLRTHDVAETKQAVSMVTNITKR